MELGTALILIAVLYLLVTNQGFRRVAVGAVIVGVVVTVALFARMAQVRHMRAAEYQASLKVAPASVAAPVPVAAAPCSQANPCYSPHPDPEPVPDLPPELAEKYSWITGPNPSPEHPCHSTIDAKGKPFIYDTPCTKNGTTLTDSSAPPKFAELTYCAGVGARNVPDKSCCPLNYQWSSKDNKCRLVVARQ